MENNDNVGIRIAILGMATFCMAIWCFYVAEAADPPPLQDFCVATNDPTSAVFTNGKVCKDPKNVTVDDFLYKGFNKRTKITNKQNAKATLVDIDLFPALNTLGVAIARVDFGAYGLNTPHWHQRGSEVFAVMKGELFADFVTSDNKMFWKLLKKGDVIVFPQALVHFQMNIKSTDAYAIAAFGSQNPGRIDLPNSVFGVDPVIPEEILKIAFQVHRNDIDNLRFQFNVSSTGSSLWELINQIRTDHHYY